MGKKANTKLNKKERALADRGHHEKKKEIKKKKREEAKRKKEFRVNRVSGVVIAFLGGVILIFFGIFLFIVFFEASDLAKILPSDKTAFFLEFRLKNRDIRRFSDALSTYPAYQPANMKKMLQDQFDLDFESDISPWFGKKAGVALLHGENGFSSLLFLQTRGKRKTLEALGWSNASDLNEIVDPAQKETDAQIPAFPPNGFEPNGSRFIYEIPFGHDSYLAFYERYAVFSKEKSSLEAFLDFQSADHERLSENRDYIKVSNNLASNNALFAYANIRQIVSAAISSRSVLSSHSAQLIFLKPLIDIFPSMGLSATFQENTLIAQTYLHIDKSSVSGNRYFRFEKKYTGDLLDFIDENHLFFLQGGHDLQSEFTRMLEIIRDVYPTASILVESVMNGAKDHYFGGAVSIEKDVLPLLSDEYAIAFFNRDGGQRFLGIFRLADTSHDREKILSLKNAFLEEGTPLNPRTETETSYGDVRVSSITFEGKDIFFAFAGDMFLVGDDPENLHSGIDFIHNGKIKPSNSAKVGNIFSSADEINLFFPASYMTLDKNDFIKEYAPFSDPVDFIASAKNVFDDGISTIYQVSFR